MLSKEIAERRKNSKNVPKEERSGVFVGNKQLKRGTPSLVNALIVTALTIIVIVSAILLAINITVNYYYKKAKDGAFKINNFELKDTIDDEYFYSSTINSTSYYNYVGNSLFGTTVPVTVLPNYEETKDQIKTNENIKNYLFIGIDTYDKEAYKNGEGVPDILFLISVNEKEKTTKFFVFDSYAFVAIPDVKEEGKTEVAPLYDAYKWGGANFLCKVISENFGIGIDGYIKMQMAAFAEVIDAVKGISITLSEEDATALNTQISASNVKFGLQIPSVTSGKITMNGDQTLAYLRGANPSRIKEVVKQVIISTFKEAVLKLRGVAVLKDMYVLIAENSNISADRNDFGDFINVVVFSIGKDFGEIFEAPFNDPTAFIHRCYFGYNIEQGQTVHNNAKVKELIQTAIYGE